MLGIVNTLTTAVNNIGINHCVQLPSSKSTKNALETKATSKPGLQDVLSQSTASIIDHAECMSMMTDSSSIFQQGGKVRKPNSIFYYGTIMVRGG